jgi:N-acetylmuramic acid 6-phosphate etherase
LITEDLNPRSTNIENLSIEEIFNIMNDEDSIVVKSVSGAKDSILRAIDDAIHTIGSGGSLIYIGAGTSGRLGILDASEIPPTFNVSSDTIRTIIAGGKRAITNSIEGAEDDKDAGKRAVSDVRVKDMLLGISASGKTPYVIAALKEGKAHGAKCWLLTCNNVAYKFLDGIIKVLVGPEIIAGSTRLKAGTATKIVLNMISTATMIKLGRVYKGYMIDVTPSNTKLINRSLKIIQNITGCSHEKAKVLLKKSGNNVKTALLMNLGGLSYKDARLRLKKSGGSLKRALETANSEKASVSYDGISGHQS